MRSMNIYSDLNLRFYSTFFFLIFTADWRLVVTKSNSYSLLGFTADFLPHTASSICQCQVTMLINRSALAAVKTQNCAGEARGSQRRLSSFWCAFPPSESLGSDIVLPVRTKTQGSPSLFFIHVRTVFTRNGITVRRSHIYCY